jgi:hypothetical protein
MRSEADVRGALTRALRANDALVQPIESAMTGLGIPDMYVRTKRVSAWVELKYERHEPRMPYTVPFRPGQWGWLARHWALGGTSVLAVWTPSGLHCFKDFEICETYMVLDGFCMPAISGMQFIGWLDNLRAGH